MSETDDQLQSRRRQTRDAIAAYQGERLDPVDRQTLSHLERQLASIEAELERRQVRTAEPSRVGVWQPLTMHEPAPTRTASSDVSPDLPDAKPAPDLDLLWAASTVGQEDLSDFVSERLPELFREWVEERERTPSRARLPGPAKHRRAPPFTPSLRDGLTTTQRAVVAALALAPTPRERLSDRGLDEHALEELLLPRPYPLVETREDGLALTGFGRELVSVEDGRARVHGAFFPNLLVNGVGDAFAFPVRILADVITAAKSLLLAADTSLERLERMSEPVVQDDFWTNSWGRSSSSDTLSVTTIPWTRPGQVSFMFPHPSDAERAEESLGQAAQRHELAEGTTFTVAAREFVVNLPRGSQGLRVVRQLWVDGALTSRWSVEATAADGTGTRPRSLRDLLEAFLETSSREMKRRLRAQRRVDSRLEVLEGLLRLVDDERLGGLVDASETPAECLWALTHLGSPALASHGRLGRFAVALEPFTEAQARAILATKGLRRKRQFLELEYEAVLAEERAKPGWVTRELVHSSLLTELNRIAALSGSDSSRLYRGRVPRWIR